VLAEKSVLRPYGVSDGASGAPNRFHVRRQGHDVEPSPVPGKVSAFPLVRDDVVVMQSSGGGGYGDPLERDVDRVLADLTEGVITRETAERVYGVVLSEARAPLSEARAPDGPPDGNGRGRRSVATPSHAADLEATRTRRREISAARPVVTLAVDDGLDEADVRRIVLDDGIASRLGAAVDDVVELVNPRGAPVRLWVAGVAREPMGVARVTSATLAMLAATAGSTLEVRAVFVRPRA
jgi:N-methylhydantoinase B